MAEEPDWKAPPIGKCSTIIIASPHKTFPPKLEGEVSMTIEVRSLLSQVMLDTSSHRSGNLTPRRPNWVFMLTPAPHKAKGTPQAGGHVIPQVSALDDVKMVETSLEGVPTTISPIAMTTRSRSITPPTDTAELWEKANKALEELLATKSSIDAHRWRAIWELGMELCQNESETAESIKEARAICSHVTLDAEALCFSTVKKAKVTCVQNYQRSQGHLHLHHPGGWDHLLCGHQGCWDPGASQAESLHKLHAKTIWDLEEQVIQEEGRSQTDFLSVCQAPYMTAQWSSEACW